MEVKMSQVRQNKQIKYLTEIYKSCIPQSYVTTMQDRTHQVHNPDYEEIRVLRLL